MDILERVVTCWEQMQARYIEALTAAHAEAHPQRRHELKARAARLRAIVDELQSKALVL